MTRIGSDRALACFTHDDMKLIIHLRFLNAFNVCANEKKSFLAELPAKLNIQYVKFGEFSFCSWRPTAKKEYAEEDITSLIIMPKIIYMWVLLLCSSRTMEGEPNTKKEVEETVCVAKVNV